MLNLTMGGRCCSGLAAVEFLERLPDSFPEELKTEDFCDDYEEVLNRVRWLVRQAEAVEPKLHYGDRSYSDWETCPTCGFTLATKCGRMPYCENCGQHLDWTQVTEKRIAEHRRMAAERRKESAK